MTIETFAQKFPAEKQALAELVKNKKKENQSNVMVLVDRIVEEGSAGLSEAFSRFHETDTASVPDDTLFTQMPPEMRHKATLNAAAVVFGLAIEALEHTLVTRELDMGFLNERHNMARAKTPLQKSRLNGEAVLKLPSEEMGKIYKAIGEDKTFSVFFTDEGLEVIPQPLRMYIRDSGLIGLIQSEIIPLHKERAQLIVDATAT